MAASTIADMWSWTVIPTIRTSTREGQNRPLRRSE
jgi:hypothetical protein